MSEQMDRLGSPAQRFGVLALNNVERVTDLQLGVLRSCSHFAMKQWRAALDVRDAQSLREYFVQHSQAVQALQHQLAEDSRKIMDVGQDFAAQALRVVRQNADSFTETARAGADRMQRETDRTARAGRGG